MTVKKKPKVGIRSTVVMKCAPSCADVIHRALSKTPALAPGILLADDANVVHVFSVVREFQSKLYDNLLKKERAIEKDLPEIAFEFHVRAHQGREPAEAVPFEAELVYAR